MSGKRHFERLLELLEIERVAEKQENLRELKRYPIATREALGKTVTGLTMDGLEGGLGGMALMTLSRTAAGEELAPFHAISAGDNVLVTFPSGSEPATCEGTMYKVDEYRATVALGAAPPSHPVRGTSQIDLLGSDATYQRMKKALVTASEAKKNRLAALREVFLGERTPERNKVPKLRFFNERLN